MRKVQRSTAVRIVAAAAALTSTSAIVLAAPQRGPAPASPAVKVLVEKPGMTARYKPSAHTASRPAALPAAQRTAALASVAAAKLAAVPGRQPFEISTTKVSGPKGEQLYVGWCEYTVGSVLCTGGNQGVGVFGIGKGGWLFDCTAYDNYGAAGSKPVDVWMMSSSGSATDSIVPHDGHVVFAAFFDKAQGNSVVLTRSTAFFWNSCKAEPI